MKSLPRWTALIVALALWQGTVRRPTRAAEGTSFHAVAGTQLAPTGDTLRVAAFNIAGGVSPKDNVLDLNRTASYLHGFDVIGMEEVHGVTLTTWRNQAEILGEILHMPWLFSPAETRWGVDAFGNGALCNLPVIRWNRIPQSTLLYAHNRSLLRLTLQWHERPLTVLIVHLDREDDHMTGFGAVSAAFRDAPLPVILMGDLNTQGSEAPLMALRQDPDIVDAIGRGEGDKLSSRNNVDWIFARGLNYVGGGLTEDNASDHRLAWAEFAEER